MSPPFTVDPAGLPVSDPDTFATGTQPRGIVFTPDGANAYVVNSGANSVTAYSVDQDGGLHERSTLPTGGQFAVGVAIAPNGRSLYMSNLGTNTVTAFGIDDQGGLSRLGEPVPDIADSPRGLAVCADGRFVFVGHGAPDVSLLTW